MTGREAKGETQRQWNTDPCGANTAADLEPGTPEFFRKVDRERYAHYAPWMMEAIGFSSFANQRVLEIGPGLGTDHAQFARAGANLFALDLTTRHLMLTRRRFQLEGFRTRPLRGDAEDLPFRADSFDAVYSFGVLHHTPDTARAVHEIHRVLRPTGLAVVALYHRHSAYHWIGTVLWRGIAKGNLWRKGYRRMLSDIEYRSPQSDAETLVKAFSRRECRRLFSSFSRVIIQTNHVEPSHFGPLVRLIPGQDRIALKHRMTLERLARYWGWYLTIFAHK